MQAIVIARAILEDERSRPHLPRLPTSCEERLVVLRIGDTDAETKRPVICDPRQAGIETRPQLRHERWQRIGEILVFATPEAVSGHDDAAAIQGVRIVSS